MRKRPTNPLPGHATHVVNQGVQSLLEAVGLNPAGFEWALVVNSIEPDATVQQSAFSSSGSVDAAGMLRTAAGWLDVTP